MATMNDTAIDAVRTGSFQYMTPATQSSLFRNGKVLTRRDKDGSDGKFQGVELEAHDMAVEDARLLVGAEHRTLEANGFEIVAHSVDDPTIDFFDHDTVARTYYPQCAEVVRVASGAAHVAAFDHNIRSASGKESKQRIDGGQQVQGPAHLVHGDYTLTSAPQRLRDLTKPSTANDTLRKLLGDGESLLDADAVELAISDGRFAIINLWRNIVEEPVATHPMALCDAATVSPEELVVFEVHYADRIGENYFAKHSDDHRWYTYPGLTRDEALLIKQWDSAGALARSNGANGDAVSPDDPCTFSFHSAFKDPTTPPEAADRWSMEVRCMVLYD
jgi:hypothetical protein